MYAITVLILTILVGLGAGYIWDAILGWPHVLGLALVGFPIGLFGAHLATKTRQ